ncbi:hypothetical protein ACVCL3_04800 [Rhodanobacter sp. UC4437_H4]
MSNMLFSRRHAQQCIERLKDVVSENELRQFVDALNRPGRDRIIKLWEIVVLDALSRVSPIQHEQPLSDGQRPDFAFPLLVDGQRVDVIGDIRCISDSGLDNQNPIQSLSDEVVRVARKMRVNPDKLDIRVQGKTIGQYRDAKMTLNLPAKSGIADFVRTEITPFLGTVRSAPGRSASIDVQRPDAILTMAYDPDQMFFRMGHPSYDVSYSIDRNPLWAALKDKADQLRSSHSDSIRLVIVCDGDCKTLKEQSPIGGHFSTTAIVENFLRRSSTVDAVLLLPVVEKWHIFQQSEISLVPEFYAKAGGARAVMTERNEIALRAHLNAFLANMPKPGLSASNAVNWCDKADFLTGLHGGYSMAGNTVKISSRQILETLAGIPSHSHPPLESPPDAPLPPANWQQHFLGYLQRGQMISKVTVVPGGDADDDTLEFEFGQPDPAIHSFRMPKAS